MHGQYLTQNVTGGFNYSVNSFNQPQTLTLSLAASDLIPSGAMLASVNNFGLQTTDSTGSVDVTLRNTTNGSLTEAFSYSSRVDILAPDGRAIRGLGGSSTAFGIAVPGNGTINRQASVVLGSGTSGLSQEFVGVFNTPAPLSLNVSFSGITFTPSAGFAVESVSGTNNVTVNLLGSYRYFQNHLWNVDSDGVWSGGSNWTGGNSPNATGLPVGFGGVITANHTVTLDGSFTAGRLFFRFHPALHAGPLGSGQHPHPFRGQCRGPWRGGAPGQP